MSLKSNISVIIRLGSLSKTTYVANIIATEWRKVLREGQWQEQQYAYVYIPGIGNRWIPPTYFVAYAV